MSDQPVASEKTAVDKRPWCLCPQGHWWLGWHHVVNVCTTCSMAATSEHATPGALTAEIEGQDRTYLDLKGALERLSRAQVNLPKHWRSDAGTAIRIVQDIGSAVFPFAWSDHDQPEYGEATRG